MNHESAKQVQITHPFGLRLPFGPSFGFCTLPALAQPLQKVKFPSLRLENSLQNNINSRMGNFVKIPNFPKPPKEDTQSVPSTASWAEGEDVQLPDSQQVVKTVEKAETMKIKSPRDLQDFYVGNPSNFDCKVLFSFYFLFIDYLESFWDFFGRNFRKIVNELFRVYFLIKEGVE